MKTETLDLASLLEVVESLRDEVSRLADRVTALEGQGDGTATTAAAGAGAAAAASPRAELDEELVATISAAIAAYLGVKPRIRQIRLLGSHSWAQQGRVTIQASHTIPVGHN